MMQFFNQHNNEKTEIKHFVFCPYCGDKLSAGSVGTCDVCGFKQYENPLLGVSILISNFENNVLVGRRKGKKDSWCLPCGYIETSENFLIAAHREVEEETGLEIIIDSIINVVSNMITPNLETLVVVLLASVAKGVLNPGDDITELIWIDSADIPSLAFKADEYIIKKYFQGGLEKLGVDPRYAQGSEPLR